MRKPKPRQPKPDISPPKQVQDPIAKMFRELAPLVALDCQPSQPEDPIVIPHPPLEKEANVGRAIAAPGAEVIEALARRAGANLRKFPEWMRFQLLADISEIITVSALEEIHHSKFSPDLAERKRLLKRLKKLICTALDKRLLPALFTRPGRKRESARDEEMLKLAKAGFSHRERASKLNLYGETEQSAYRRARANREHRIELFSLLRTALEPLGIILQEDPKANPKA